MTNEMPHQKLRELIDQRQINIGVIGLGYVGLPVACSFANAGFNVIGLDVDVDRVAMINSGRSPIGGDEPGLADLLIEMIDAGRLRATIDYAELTRADVILIAVQTPIDDQHQPDYSALEAACRNLGGVLKPRSLVIVESTTSPGTLNNFVRAWLEKASGLRCVVSANLAEGLQNEDRSDVQPPQGEFYLGVCPERVTPGKLLHNLRTMSRVCGGGTSETSLTMITLYRHIVEGDLDPADWVTAELVKTAENADRDVNIAFANELALISESVGSDFLRVRELVNKVPGRNVLLAGAGVGGHCIPKDPWLLDHAAHGSTRLIRAARSINDAMPLHIVELTVEAWQNYGREIAGSRVALLGYAYLENSDDTRNSPSEVVVQQLRQRGVQVMAHDPWVKEYQSDVQMCLKNADAVIVMVAHNAYYQLDLPQLRSMLRTPILIDGRRIFDPVQARSAGLIYRAVGLAAH